MIYNAGLDALRDIATADLRWLLLRGYGYAFDKDHATLTALTLATNEVTVTGYARPVLTSGVRTVDNTNDRVTYAAANPSFGTLTTGQDVTGLVLYRRVTNDADSIPVAYFALVPTDTAAFAPFVVTLTNGLVATTSEA